MLERLKRMFGTVEKTAITQPQREAMIDLLLWTMYADRVIALSENDRIDQLAAELSWESVTPFPIYLNTSLARVREVLSDDGEAAKLLDDIHVRLGNEPMRRKAYEACRAMAGLDGEVTEEEAQFLDRVRTRFGL